MGPAQPVDCKFGNFVLAADCCMLAAAAVVVSVVEVEIGYGDSDCEVLERAVEKVVVPRAVHKQIAAVVVVVVVAAAEPALKQPLVPYNYF